MSTVGEEGNSTDVTVIPALSKKTIGWSILISITFTRLCAGVGASWIKGTMVWPIVLIACYIAREGEGMKLAQGSS